MNRASVPVSVGPLDAVPTDRCVAVADGAAVVVRIGDDVFAHPNRCLHQDSPLDGGWVRDGVLTCPLHFWRYDATTGACRNRTGALASYRVDVVDGEVWVDLPGPTEVGSLRDRLLARAQSYDRTDAWRAACEEETWRAACEESTQRAACEEQSLRTENP